jgi:hypothetical protein
MRFAALALVGVFGLLGAAASARAAPAIPNLGPQQDPNIIRVWGGCGWGFHPTPGAVAFQTDTATTGTGHTGEATMAAVAIIRIGATGTGTDIDRQVFRLRLVDHEGKRHEECRRIAGRSAPRRLVLAAIGVGTGRAAGQLSEKLRGGVSTR